MLTTTQSVSEAGGSGFWGLVGELEGNQEMSLSCPYSVFLVHQGLELWWHRCGDGP